MASTTRANAWLTRYAAVTAASALALIALGGLVTSHGAGLAVPDWPTTYGYNMFLFPVSQWIGGIFYEHTHRLAASWVGLMTIVLALWLQRSGQRPALKRLGWLAVVLVVVQGVLGGLRVNLLKDELGMVHAALAQGFFVLLVLITLFTSRWWTQAGGRPAGLCPPGAYRTVALATSLIFVQLLVGAAMRHQHAGLAIPDFPLAYGRVWPPTDADFLARVNQGRIDARDFAPLTAFQILLQMIHRVLALILTALIAASWWKLRGSSRSRSLPARLGLAWVTLIAVQVLLGAATIWSNKAADLATAHVVVGAACLAVGAIATAVLAQARVESARERSEVRIPVPLVRISNSG